MQKYKLFQYSYYNSFITFVIYITKINFNQ